MDGTRNGTIAALLLLLTIGVTMTVAGCESGDRVRRHVNAEFTTGGCELTASVTEEWLAQGWTQGLPDDVLLVDRFHDDDLGMWFCIYEDVEGRLWLALNCEIDGPVKRLPPGYRRRGFEPAPDTVKLGCQVVETAITGDLDAALDRSARSTLSFAHPGGPLPAIAVRHASARLDHALIAGVPLAIAAHAFDAVPADAEVELAGPIDEVVRTALLLGISEVRVPHVAPGIAELRISGTTDLGGVLAIRLDGAVVWSGFWNQPFDLDVPVD